MSKHHHQSKEEQINNKIQDELRFQQGDMPYPRNESIKSEDIPTLVAEDKFSIQRQAYELYCEKGGSDLDNWLEAERMLRTRDGLLI